MITIRYGNLLTSQAQALVNTVNTEGAMGKGIALQFARAFPDILSPYEAACRTGELVPGRVQVIERPGLVQPQFIINFPTKRHWRGKSRLADIEAGLRDLVRVVQERRIRSIALPPLGCGLGGLVWDDVRPRIEAAFGALPDVEVLLFPPEGAPAPADQPNRTPRPKLTPARARVIEVLAAYLALGYELSLLEVQKLLYFLQTAGDELSLDYGKHRYGPYADGLRHVLKRFEGHFTQGYGDGNDAPGTQIELLPDAQAAAAAYLAEAREGGDDAARLDRVVALIEGFESPYGLELLATVHWVASREGATTLDEAIARVHAWSDSKRQRMSAEHIRLAWHRLVSQGWIATSPAGPGDPADQPDGPAATEPAAPPQVAAASPGGRYDHLEREQLIRLLERRDHERQLGLVWERDEIEAERALNDDYVALTLDESLSHGQAPWRDLIIEGDNFDALRALRMSHAGRIRCIYIDPPYNTGNRDFVYNDRFVDKTHRFRHSLWLEFMHRRLLLARELLAPDGVIFVSIDDNEVFRLGMLMDQVFGERNYVETFSWVRTRTPAALSRKSKKVTEYVLCYEKVKSNRAYQGIEKPAQSSNPLLNQPNRVSRLLFPAGMVRTKLADGVVPPGTYGTKRYSIELITPARVLGGVFVDEFEMQARFRWDQEYLQSQLASGVRVSIATKTMVPSYEKDSYGREALPNLIDESVGVGTNEQASTELDGIFAGAWDAISTGMRPKPTSLVSYLVNAVSGKDDIILDFFAGSGTSAHAVAKLNAEDGGSRRCILISSTEATIDEPDKNLCRDVCAERVRRVLGGYTNGKGEAVAGLGGGFAYLRARRIAPHRLATRIDHPEVWHALCLMHDLPLAPWAGNGLAAAAGSDCAIAYVADVDAGTETALRDWSATIGELPLTLYAWTPERVRGWAPTAQCAPIPESLRLRFGR
jgi:adenine-specific DNA-methyltransferase